MRRPGAHYLRHNRTTRLPRVFVYLDSEARQIEDGRLLVQSFRCAVTCVDRRNHHDGGWSPRVWAEHDSTSGLWATVDGYCGERARVVVVAHKLDYDLRVTDALVELPALGWKLDMIRLDRGSCWCTWRDGRRTLAMVDSLSWLPAPLERVGELVGVPKLALPAWDDSDAAWLARCRRDVEILGVAWRRLMEWVVDADLGVWKPTGAGQSFAAFRHRFMSHRILAHDDVPAREAERRSVWTGRCETWRWGRQSGGPFTEWDYSSAYAAIGAECEVPIRLIGHSEGTTARGVERLAGRYSVLADVIVTTETPVLPCRRDGRIVWPVGTFRTTVWEHELALAEARGARVTVERAWWYRRAPALRAFCEWVLGLLGAPDGVVDPVVRLAVKHWSRALIGRFGARWSTWETWGRSPASDLLLAWATDDEREGRYRFLQVGRELRRETAEEDSPDAVPAIMAWVMGEARCRLWRACEAAGLGNVLYVDTDSLITTATGTERLLEAAVAGLRPKGRWNTVELLGPRQIVLQGALRAAGVPRGSVRVGPDTWEGEVWSELATDLRQGRADRVTIRPRRVRLVGADCRREHLAGGGTAPWRVELDRDGVGASDLAG